MSKRIVGETDAGSFWHKIDESGPDLHVAVEMELPNALSLFKTKCGRHYNSDPVDEAFAVAHSFAMCPNCT